MQKYYLAVDIGASSGRHMLGHIENGNMILEEIYRFPNGMSEKDGELCWDIEQLFQDILTGMKKCKELGKIPCSMGIDTWAVDFILLDKQGKRIGNPVGYRDGRTKGADELVYRIIPQDELYAATGIQKQMFNTIYQLMAVKRDHPEYLEEAEHMLMIPEYFHYLLTGKMASEYTNATTTQLVHPEKKDWDVNLIEALGFPKKLFGTIVPPGTLLGTLTGEVKKEVGFDCDVIITTTHDTASAVVAVPTNKENTVYISSGTWSLLGTECSKANCSMESQKKNFTNEGGYGYRFRYLKNIMGLWMIQSVRKELAPEQSFGEICRLASLQSIDSMVDCNDDRFLAPANMTEEIKAACAEQNMQVPDGIAEVAAVIYQSLAKCYQDAVEELEQLTGAKYDSIHIVGGGANADYLNELTAKATKRTVYAGPTEATAIGNLTVQMIAKNELKDLNAARACIFDSFRIKTF